MDINEIYGEPKESTLGIYLVATIIIVGLIVAHREVLAYLDSLLK